MPRPARMMEWTPPRFFFGIIVPGKEPFKDRQEEPVNESKTIAVDLAKDVFELSAADAHWRTVERHRLTRAPLSRYFQNRAPME